LRGEKQLLRCVDVVRLTVGGKQSFCCCIKYRQIFNYEINLQFFTHKEWESDKNLNEEGKMGKENEFHSHHGREI